MASVNYSIKGKYDKKAVEQAKSGFKSLQSTIKNINSLISGFAAVKAVQSISKLANATKDIFVNQNEALTKFNTAVSKTNLNLGKLQTIQTKVSKNNFFDGDSINNAMQMAVQMGLTEDQIENVMTAATDMAASGIMPLDNAVKALSLSYSGNVSQLKKVAPELDNLTKHQLQNGDAVEILMKKYDGFGDAMSSTFSGRNTQWQNSIDDLKASIGSIPTSLEFITQGKLLEPLNKVTEWITTNRDYILNFFLDLPAVAKTVFTSIGNMIKKTWNNLPELIQSLGPILVDMWKNSVLTWINVVKEAFKGIHELLEYAIKNPFVSKGKDFINTFLNSIIEGINDLPQKLPKWAKAVFGIDENTEPIKFRFSTDNAGKAKSWEETAANISKAISNAATAYKSGNAKQIEDLKKLAEKLTDFYSDDTDKLVADLKSILGQDLPEDLKKALAGVVYNGSGAGGNGGTNGGTNINADTKKALLSGAGQLGTYISAFGENGPMGLIAQVVKDILNELASASEVVNKFFNLVSYFIQEFVQPLVQLLEPVLIPILSVVKSIGGIIGSFLGIFAPFARLAGWALELIAKILFWVKTFFVSLFDTIRYGFIEIENWIIKIYNKLTGWFSSHINEKSQDKSWGEISTEWASLVDKELFEKAFYSSLEGGVSGESLSSASGSSGATYTAARDNIVYFTYNNSFVNGDARDIAIAMKHEMDQASRMGYL